MFPHRLRRSSIFAGLAVAILLAAVAQPSASAESPEEERESVQQEQLDVDAELDVLRASEAELAAELDRLASEVAGAEAELANAQSAVDAAESEVARIDRQLADLEVELEELQAAFNESAVQTYIDGGTVDPLGGLAELEPNAAAVRQELRDITRGDIADLTDALSRARAEQQQARDDAQEARSRAEGARNEAAARVADFQQIQAEQQAVSVDIATRMDNALYEAAALEEQDAQLAAEIRENQRELAARLAAIPPPQPKPVPTPSGSASVPPTSPAPDEPADPPLPTPLPDLPEPPGGIVTVAGIQVAATIAPQVEGLMSKAAADGVPLAGSGFRNPQEQIALRIRNCGSSNYAIYEMPPEQCNPDTALPGRSKHEVGLAIDFNWGGQLIETRGHPGFQWLAANAPSFGFANLPSEPWHWSIDGT